MAWVTTLGPDASQVDYRLQSQCGCDQAAHTHAEDSPEHAHGEETARAAEDYRLYGAARAVERVGSGWAAFGERAGTPLGDEAALESMRQVMAGRDPRTGEQLVKAKMAVDARAKLEAAPLVEAVRAVAEAAHMEPQALLDSPRLAARFARLEKGLVRDGQGHRAPVAELEAIAEAAGVDPGRVWEASDLERARAHGDDRVRVGNRGYDLVLNMPKSVSLAFALSDEKTAAQVEEIYLESVRETVADVEGWVAYGLSGHHGDGERAQRVEAIGFAASITLHRSARPVQGQMGDPHIHAHVMIPNMVQCADGKWRTLAAGGRDLHRHVAVAGELAKARMREKLTRRLGAVWEQDERTGEWEIAGFDAALRGVFSSRARQINALVGEEASREHKQAAGRVLAEAKNPLSETGTARQAWRARAEAADFDVDAVVAGALPGAGAGGPEAFRPSLEELVATVWDPQTGVTSQRKVASRAQVMAAVAAALPGGVGRLSELEVLTDAVMASDEAVAMPTSEGAHLSNADRVSSRRIVEAERTIVGSAERRLGQGVAVVERPQAVAVLRAFEAERGFALSAEQRRVAGRLMGAGHGLDVVRGVAGAGKTTLMSAVNTGWVEAGYRVEGAAVAAVAASNLQAESGIASSTVATWLQRIGSGPGLEGVDVLVVDEAAMVNDLDMAVLVAEAERTGTKVVGIGDPKQLRAIGVGGTFAAVHTLVKGDTLTHNRRQSDAVDQQALAAWLEEGREVALSVWGRAGRVHAAERAHQAHEAIAQAWWGDRQGIGDRFQGVEDVLVLAARNGDVDELNHRLRSLARAGGHLQGEEVGFALRGGERLALAAGDVVRVRRNDYRSRRGEGEDVLNGFRGVVAEVDARRGARVEWRRRGRVHSAWISPEAIGRGDLSHGYAMTIAAAQGLTCARVHVYGIGADAHSLYPAMTRSRKRADLYLASEALQDPKLRERLAGARNDKDVVEACVSAYARTLEVRSEGLVIDELDGARSEPAQGAPRQRPNVGPGRGGIDAPVSVDKALGKFAARKGTAGPVNRRGSGPGRRGGRAT
ncbi:MULTISPECIES: MobF family relaxase [Nocardiopsidaceae]|uniref:Relaxase domain-containing protein n=1 Tax=Streptomonospora nanhaiensis TaxID=1323731 RepID=A0ABY6YXZ4_9ACTN|nr:MobF family relaxase [Streptomonospora nanhaiensis]WAE76851.1 relaxase domain-containing protein [Streptomonospora nanhaiensis]